MADGLRPPHALPYLRSPSLPSLPPFASLIGQHWTNESSSFGNEPCLLNDHQQRQRARHHEQDTFFELPAHTRPVFAQEIVARHAFYPLATSPRSSSQERLYQSTLHRPIGSAAHRRQSISHHSHWAQIEHPLAIDTNIHASYHRIPRQRDYPEPMSQMSPLTTPLHGSVDYNRLPSLSPVSSMMSPTVPHQVAPEHVAINRATVAALRSDEYTVPPAVPVTVEEEVHYELIMREHPVHARACGLSWDSRTLDPTPIIELRITGANQRLLTKDMFERTRFVMNVTLLDEDGRHSRMNYPQGTARNDSNLVGELYHSGMFYKDEFDQEGCYFCFGGLSCRMSGRYRLRFMLFRFDFDALAGGKVATRTVAEIDTNPFEVSVPRLFSGRLNSSNLVIALKQQGAKVDVRKGPGPEQRAHLRRRREQDDDGEEDRDETRRSRS